MVVGGLAFPLMKEAVDIASHRWVTKDETNRHWQDGVADLIQYQLLVWPMSALEQHDPTNALLIAAVFWTAYVLTLPWIVP